MLLRRLAPLVLLLAASCRSPPDSRSACDAAGLADAGQATVASREAPGLPARPLLLGRPPHLSATRAEYAPLAAYLAGHIDHAVEVEVPASYEAVVELLVAGKLDMALLTPLTYVIAHHRLPALRPLATLLGEGAARYRGYVVVKAGSPLRALADLRGKRFAFVEHGSASGNLFPRALLIDAGLDPARDLGATRYLTNHTDVVHAVLAGSVDAGAISSTTFAHLRREGLHNRLDILAKSDWIPFDAFVVHPRIPAATAAALQAALLALSMRSPEGRAVLDGVATINGFVPTDDAHYEPVRRVARRLGLLGEVAAPSP